MAGLFRQLPWLPIGLAISMIVALPASRPVARILGSRVAVAWLLLVAVGLVVSATLTPLRGELDHPVPGTPTCDLTRVGPPGLDELLRPTDRALNIILFAPLGVAVALVPSRRRTVLVLGAVALPFAIEALQLALPALGRGCQSADVVDNLIGLGAGLGIGVLATRAGRGQR